MIWLHVLKSLAQQTLLPIEFEGMTVTASMPKCWCLTHFLVLLKTLFLLHCTFCYSVGGIGCSSHPLCQHLKWKSCLAICVNILYMRKNPFFYLQASCSSIPGIVSSRLGECQQLAMLRWTRMFWMWPPNMGLPVVFEPPLDKTQEVTVHSFVQVLEGGLFICGNEQTRAVCSPAEPRTFADLAYLDISVSEWCT